MLDHALEEVLQSEIKFDETCDISIMHFSLDT